METNAVVNQACSIDHGQSRWRPLYSAVAVFALTVGAGSAHAGPQGGEIVAGRGNIARAGADVTVINQQSSRLGINWDSFNVAAHESVVFQQPGSSSIALNRILDHNPSQILGAINANGQVFLINPSGIIFGETARVNLHSIVASSLDISTEDFMNGNYDLKALSDRAGGLVVNRGLIQAATGGSVTLVGGTVANEGLIVADYGQVNLAAGKRATLDFDGDRLMLFEVSEDILENTDSQASAVSNSGTIQADGGQVLLTGRAASDVFGSVVNNSGVIRAGRIENVGGVVRLVADSGTVLNSGNIDVSGTRDGGQVALLGERVGVYDGAQITADGETGGGTVLVGGGYQGNDPNVMNADRTFVGATTQISADATRDGDGGTIIVWSEEVTRAYGDLSARGGADGGDGGFIETSSRDWLDVQRTPDVTAPNGDGGTWLIDPNNIAIVALSGCNNIIGCPTPAGPNFVSSGDAAEIGVDLINTALGGGADVVITTASQGGSMEDGNITWAAGVVLDTQGGDGGSLELNAVNDITIDGEIRDNTGANDSSIDLILVAGGNVSISGTIDLLNGTLTAGIGGIALGGSFTHTGSFTGSGMSVFATTDLTMAGTVAIGGTGPLTVDLNAGQGGTGSMITLDFASLTGATTTTVTGGNGIDVFLVNADLTADLAGGAGADTFTLAGGILTGMIDGGTNTTTLTADNVANTWMLNGPQAGTVTGITGGFTGIDNVVGGTSTDDFTVSAGWLGNVSGGAGADDFALAGGTIGGVLDGGTNVNVLTADNVANMWMLNGAQTGTVTGITGGFTGIDNVVGGTSTDNFTVTAGWLGNVSGGAGVDSFTLAGGTIGGTLDGGTNVNTLTAGNVANTWMLNGPQAGTVTGITGGFTNIDNVVGGNTTDDVTVTAGWLGNVSGGAGADDFTLAGGTIGGVLDGGTNVNVLTADNVANTWMLNGAQAGTVTGITGGFTGIDNVVGGTSTDNFTVTAGWLGNVSGGAGADDFTLAGGTIGGTLDGGTNVNTLTAGNVANTWMLNGPQAGTVTGITGGFTNIDNVVGGNTTDEVTVTAGWLGDVSGSGGADNFTLAGGTIGGTLDGGTNVNTLTADNVANTWGLSGPQAGTVTGITGGFTNIDNVVGGSATDEVTVSAAWLGDVDTGGDNDTVIFNPGSSIAGVIDGGAGDDTLDWNGFGAPIDFTLMGAGSMDGFAGSELASVPDEFDNIEDVVTPVGFSNSFTGPESDNDWVLNGTQNFLLNTIQWDGFSNVTGGGMADDFIVEADFAGDVNGGSGNDTFILTTGTVGGSIDGNGGTNILTAANVANTWVLNAAAGGTVTGVTGGFSNITNIVGGGNTDSVTVSDAWGGAVSTGGNNDQVIFTTGGSVAGAINGGAGTDTLDWSAFDAGVNQGINFFLTGAGSPDGFAGSETTSAAGGFDGFDQVATTAFDDSFTAPDTANTWDLGNAGAFTLNTVPWNGFANVTGGSMTDDFTISGAWGGNVSGGGGTDMFMLTTGTVAGAVDGQGGTDTLTAANVVNTWQLLLGTSGTVTGVGGNFLNIDNIVGGSNTDNVSVFATWAGEVSTGGNNDQIVFAPGSSIGGLIDGGAGLDTLDWSGFVTPIAFTLGGDGMTDGFAGTEAASAALGFDNFDVVLTTGAGDSFTATDAVNSWDLGNAGAFTLNTVMWDGFANVTGGSLSDNFTISGMWVGDVNGGDGNDNFTLTTGTVGGTVRGQVGEDTLTAANVLNTWTLTGGAGGSVTGLGASFVGVENVVGGTATDNVTVSGGWNNNVTLGDGDDSVIFDPAGSVAGAIDGGAGTDTLDWSGSGAAIAILLTGDGIGSDNGSVGLETNSGAAFDNINVVMASGVGDTLTAADNNTNMWDLTGPQSFILNTVQWDGFADAIGGGLTDEFTVSGAFAGNVGGGAGNDTFLLTTGSIGGTLDGGAGGIDTLTAANGMNMWDLTGADAGTVTGITGGFTGIDNVFGGTMIDVYTVSGAFAGDVSGGNGDDAFTLTTGTIGGTLDGGTGTNLLTAANTINTWVISGATAGTVNGIASGFTGITNVTGGTAADDFTLSAAFGGAINGGAGVNSLTAANTINTWTLTGERAGAVTGVAGDFTNITNVTGGSTTDIFDVTGMWAGNVSGGSGDDEVYYEDTGDVGGTVAGNDGVDLVSFENATGTRNVMLGNGEFLTVESFVGNSGALTGANLANDWLLDDIAGGSVTNAGGIVDFNDFSAVNGGAASDRVTVAAGNTWAGTVTGGAGNDVIVFGNGSAVTGAVDGGAGADALDWSAYAARTVALQGNGTVDGQAGTEADSVTAGFDNIDSFITSGINDSLIATDIANVWIINGVDAFMLNNEAYTGFANLIGGADIDDFTLSGGSLTGAIDGAAGVNTLTGDNVASAYTITGASSGTTAAVAGGFNNIANVTGGSEADVFTVASDFTGSLGGGAGSDQFILQGGSALGGLDGGADNDTLTGGDSANTWLLTDAGTGTINGRGFTSFETAIGGDAVDTVTVSGAYGGVVDGGAGNDSITIASGGSVANVLGGEGNDTLTAGDSNDAFIVNGANSGSLNGAAFAAVENLDGAGGDDIFTVANGADASLAGTISGGMGDDTLTVDYAGAAGRVLTFDGGAGSDMVAATGGGAGFAGSYNAGTGSLDYTGAGSLDYTGAGNTQSILASTIESVIDTVIADSLVVSGTPGDDAFELATGTAAGTNPMLITLAGGTPIDVANKTDITIDGADGDDAVNITSNVTVAGTLELNAESVTSGGGSITATLLRLVGTAMAGANNALLTAIETLQVLGGSGDVNLEEADDLVFAASDTTGLVSVMAGGAVTQTGAVTAAGGATLDAASITLADAGNDFGGIVTLTSQGDATIADQNALTLGASSVGGNLSAAASAGGLSSTGAVTVGGTTVLSATDGNVEFDNAANSFTGLVTIAAANNATLSAGSALTLGGATVAGNYSATSTGSIELQQLLAAGGNVSLLAGGTMSESGVGAITGNTLTVQATGGIALQGDNAVSGLNANNNGGVLAFTNTGDLSVAGISQSGNGAVTINNTGSISVPGAVTAGGGTVSFDATQAFSQAGNIMTGGGGLSVNAQTGITMATTAVTSSSEGDIVYCTQTGDILLGLLDAGAGDVEIKTVAGNIFSINGVTNDNVIAKNVILDASRAIGSPQQSIGVNAPAGNAGLITIENTSASQVFLANANNTNIFNETTSQIIDFGAAAAIAAFQAGQSSTLQDVGFVDLALFSPDVTLINTIGAGVLMPCDQLDDEEARCQ